MKKLFFFALVSIVLASCSTGRYVPNSQNLNLTQTQVILSEGNFRVVKHVQAVTTYKRTWKFEEAQLTRSAYAELVRKADLKGSQVLINVTIEQVQRLSGIFVPQEDNAIIASGTVIEFINPNAPQEINTDTPKTMSVEEMMANIVRDFVNKHSQATLGIESVGMSRQQLHTCYNSFLSKFNNEISSYSNFRLTSSETDLTAILQLKSDGNENYTATIQWIDKKTGNKALSELGNGDINTLSKTFVRLVRSHTN